MQQDNIYKPLRMQQDNIYKPLRMQQDNIIKPLWMQQNDNIRRLCDAPHGMHAMCTTGDGRGRPAAQPTPIGSGAHPNAIVAAPAG
jgi:hypothetical protein